MAMCVIGSYVYIVIYWLTQKAEQAAEMVMKGVNGENVHYYLADRKVFLELARLLLTFTNR